MRLLRRLILLGALAAGAAYLKQLLDQQRTPTTQESSPAEPSRSNGSSSSNGSEGATKAELYEEAQRLGIEGRSKMSKAELERAIRSAGGA